MGEPSWDPGISSEGEHHAGVRSEGEKTTMPDADDEESNEDNCAIWTEYIDQDLEYWLSQGRIDGVVKVLDRKKQAQN